MARAEPPRDSLGRKAADTRELIEALVEGGVDFLLVGGLAVAAHGYGRMTLDVDILVSPNAPNLARLATVLRDLEAVVIGERGAREPISSQHPESLAVGDYHLDTRHGALDLVNGSTPDLKRYRRLDQAAVVLTVAGRSVKVISKDDLIAMKREAGRPKDLRDIAALTEVERNG